MTHELPKSYEVLITLEDVETIGRMGLISLDLDGVVVDLAHLPLARFNSEHKTSYTLQDLNHPYSMDDWYIAKYNCTRDEARIYTTALWNSAEFLENAPVVKGADEILRLLDRSNISYRFVTSRPFSVFSSTQTWFQRTIGGDKMERVLIQTSDKYNMRHKVETIRNWGIKVHFEDMPAHAMEIVENTEAIVVMVNHPWNRSLPAHPKIARPALDPVYDANLLHSFSSLVRYLKSPNGQSHNNY